MPGSHADFGALWLADVRRHGICRENAYPARLAEWAARAAPLRLWAMARSRGAWPAMEGALSMDLTRLSPRLSACRWLQQDVAAGPRWRRGLRRIAVDLPSSPRRTAGRLRPTTAPGPGRRAIRR